MEARFVKESALAYLIQFKFKVSVPIVIINNLKMQPDEDDGEFNSEQVQQIAENAVNTVIGSETIEYQREKVNQWSQQIIEGCIKDLAKLQKEFKYVVTCIIQ